MPLEIELRGPATPRIAPARQHALAVQAEATSAWNAELETRFTAVR